MGEAIQAERATIYGWMLHALQSHIGGHGGYSLEMPLDIFSSDNP